MVNIVHTLGVRTRVENSVEASCSWSLHVRTRVGNGYLSFLSWCLHVWTGVGNGHLSFLVLKTFFIQQCFFVPCLLLAVDKARQALCWSEVGCDIASWYCCFLYELDYQSFFQFVGNSWLLVCILISLCIWLEALSNVIVTKSINQICAKISRRK